MMMKKQSLPMFKVVNQANRVCKGVWPTSKEAKGSRIKVAVVGVNTLRTNTTIIQGKTLTSSNKAALLIKEVSSVFQTL
jgi:hypothetical protein